MVESEESGKKSKKKIEGKSRMQDLHHISDWVQGNKPWNML